MLLETTLEVGCWQSHERVLTRELLEIVWFLQVQASLRSVALGQVTGAKRFCLTKSSARQHVHACWKVPAVTLVTVWQAHWLEA